jgi:tetratricopeptide (TPR) repeat protein
MKDLTGQRIGAYQIVRRIGAGGMAEVYLASRADQQFHKQVAIKLVLPGTDNQEIMQRFRLERETLAALDHPNIVKLMDGGTTEDGVPYLVMDYVEGVPITEYCETHHLSVTERLRLFRTVCSAVHYAHQNLVIHRDIKPSNILVVGDGTAKLLDFGIAKVLRPETAAHAGELTRAGLRPMTLKYASPEQVRGQPITIATDVYSLGVLLYELLAGHHPYDLPTDIAVAVAICEREPEKPSTHHRLDQDLDAIVLMAMRKEPGRRYPSVEHFSEDIRRHLEGVPVLARKSTLAYRVDKLVRRHKVGAPAVAFAVVVLIASMVAITWEAGVARAHQARAERRFNQVRELANTFLFELDDAIKDLPGSTPARKLAAGKASDYLEKLAREASGDPSFQLELTEAYLKLGDIQGHPYVSNVGDPSGALASFRKALGIAEAVSRGDPGDLKARRYVAQSHRAIAEVLPILGNATDAVANLRQAVGIFESLTAAQPRNVAALTDLASCYAGLGDLLGNPGLSNLGDKEGALASYRKSLTAWTQVAATEPENLRARRGLAIANMRIADMLASQDPASALAHYQRALGMLESSGANPSNADAQRLVAMIYRKTGYAMADMGDMKGALGAYLRALPVYEALVSADPNNVRARLDLAVALKTGGDLMEQTGDLAGAMAAYGKVVDIIEALSGADPNNIERRSQLSEMLVIVGGLLARTGQNEEARKQTSRGLAIARQLADQQHATPGQVNTCALALLTAEPADLRNPLAALRYATRAVEMTKGADPGFLDTQAEAYFAGGAVARAIETEEKALSLLPASTHGNPASRARRVFEGHLTRYKGALKRQ